MLEDLHAQTLFELQEFLYLCLLQNWLRNTVRKLQAPLL